MIAYCSRSMVGAERADLRGHVVEIVLRQLRVDRQADDLGGELLRVRQRAESRGVGRVRGLEVRRQRGVHAGADALLGEMCSKRIALCGPDHEQVEYAICLRE